MVVQQLSPGCGFWLFQEIRERNVKAGFSAQPCEPHDAQGVKADGKKIRVWADGGVGKKVL